MSFNRESEFSLTHRLNPEQKASPWSAATCCRFVIGRHQRQADVLDLLTKSGNKLPHSKEKRGQTQRSPAPFSNCTRH